MLQAYYLQAFDDVLVVSRHRSDGFAFIELGVDPDFGFVHHIVGFLKHLVDLTVQVDRDGNSSILGCPQKHKIITMWNRDFNTCMKYMHKVEYCHLI